MDILIVNEQKTVAHFGHTYASWHVPPSACLIITYATDVVQLLLKRAFGQKRHWVGFC